jgi:hypothetical protein
MLKQNMQKRQNAYQKPILWALAALLFFLLISFGHEQVSLWYVAVFKIFGRAAMESGLHLLSLLSMAITAFALWRIRSRIRMDFSTASLWALLVGGFIAADVFLVSTNIERVHYPQYAILALLWLPAVGSPALALLLTSLCGVADELMQYLLMPHYTKYLDFNDFILNVLGAALGLALARTITWQPLVPPSMAQFFRRFTLGIVMALALLIGLAAATDRLAGYRPPLKLDGEKAYAVLQEHRGRTQFVLALHRTDNFWSGTDYGRRYHILRPLPGTLWFLAANLLFLFFFQKKKRVFPGGERKPF